VPPDNDEIGGVDDFAPVKRLLGYFGDLAVLDTDVAPGIEMRFRVHYPPVQNHEVISTREQSKRLSPNLRSRDHWGGSDPPRTGVAKGASAHD
jgi:hypothetical protein